MGGRTWTVEAVLTELLDHEYLGHVSIYPPRENPYGTDWLVVGVSGGTPVRGYGKTLAAAVADLERKA